MIKKLSVMLLSLIFLCGSILAADKKANVKKEEPKKVTTVKKYTPPEPKNAPFKEKIGIGIDVINKMASLRFWLANKLSLDANAGLSFAGGDPSSFILKLGSNIVFPMVDDQKLRLDLMPGISLAYSKNTSEELAGFTFFSEAGDISTLKFIFNIGLSFEVFLGPISNDLSIGSQIGLAFGIKSTSVGSSSTTNFVFSLAEDFAVSPIIIRYYL